MSRAICSDAILGAREVVQRARVMVSQTIAEHGPDHPVAFPGTAYHLPVIYSFTGAAVEKLSDMEPVLQRCSDCAGCITGTIRIAHRIKNNQRIRVGVKRCVMVNAYKQVGLCIGGGLSAQCKIIAQAELLSVV